MPGSQVTLNNSTLNDGKFSVDVGTSGDKATNSGTIQAADAELRANGGNVYALAGNTNGVIAATGTSSGGGKVFLSAGGGDLTVSGTVTAQNTDGSGGQITARAGNINVSGTIDASATASGKTGGSVSIIAANTTTVTGTIHARGDNATGGAIETSGETVSDDGAQIDAGQGGQWLLDPLALFVDAHLASEVEASLNAGTSVTLAITSSGPTAPYTLTGNERGGQNTGILWVQSPISWTGAATLTLSAWANLNIQSPISLSNGTLDLTAGAGTTGAINVEAPITVTGAGHVNLSASTSRR